MGIRQRKNQPKRKQAPSKPSTPNNVYNNYDDENNHNGESCYFDPPRRRKGARPMDNADAINQRRYLSSPGESRKRRLNVDSARTSRDRRRSNYVESEDDDSIWMDVSTFKQFLRREMDLRLWVLGPSWKDQIRNESQWRLGLYKQWKNMLEDGFGDDLAQDYLPQYEYNNNE